MTYNTPELQRVGTAKNLVLGGTGKQDGRDNCEAVGEFEYVPELIFHPDESEW